MSFWPRALSITYISEVSFQSYEFSASQWKKPELSDLGPSSLPSHFFDFRRWKTLRARAKLKLSFVTSFFLTNIFCDKKWIQCALMKEEETDKNEIRFTYFHIGSYSKPGMHFSNWKSSWQTKSFPLFNDRVASESLNTMEDLGDILRTFWQLNESFHFQRKIISMREETSAQPNWKDKNASKWVSFKT